MKPEIEKKLSTLPTSPGVYIFKGEKEKILYVGKAMNLRSRVRSYFQQASSDVRAFIEFLDRFLVDIETVVTRTEKDATLLENQLIKEHQPYFNVKLKDDKDYLSIRLDEKEKWPRLRLVRKPKPDQAKYFGPYPSATNARRVVRLINRHFQLRTCSDRELKNRSRPCLQYHIKRCPAPCVLPVEKDGYFEQVETVKLFLQGNHRELVDVLKEKMQLASNEMAFEQAARYRDQIHAVEKVQEEQQIVSVKKIDQDVVGFFRNESQAMFVVLKIRAGKMTRVERFPLEEAILPEKELLSSFLTSFFAVQNEIPHELLLPVEIELKDGVEEFLSEKANRKVQIHVPKRGQKAKLIRLARENAVHAHREQQLEANEAENKLAEIMVRLGLLTIPQTIECIDISHSSGADTVAAIVTLENGEIQKEKKRIFKIQANVNRDDYAAMREALSRRLERAKNKEKNWELPDLLLVDGGKGQMNVAISAASDLEIEGLQIAGIAKEKKKDGEQKEVDRIFVPGRKNPIFVHSHRAFLLLAKIRDEAHRASNAYRTQLGKKKKMQSPLDRIEGVGPKTKIKLLSQLGSLEAIRHASLESLMEAGASKKQAEKIQKHLLSIGSVEGTLNNS